MKAEPKQKMFTCSSGKEMWGALYTIFEQKNERLDLSYSHLLGYVNAWESVPRCERTMANLTKRLSIWIG